MPRESKLARSDSFGNGGAETISFTNVRAEAKA